MNLEELLYENAPLVREAMLNALPARADCDHVFSSRFLRRMRPLLRRARHPVLYRALRQTAACFLTLLVLGGSYLAVDTDARAAFLQWVREVYETQIVYRFAGVPAETGVYRPAWLPEGYEEWRSSNGTLANIIYSNEDGTILDFSYGSMQTGTGFALTDTDKAVLYQVDVSGIPGELYLSTDPTLSNTLIWLDEECGMYFGISGFLSESDILHMENRVYLANHTN